MRKWTKNVSSRKWKFKQTKDKYRLEEREKGRDREMEGEKDKEKLIEQGRSVHTHNIYIDSERERDLKKKWLRDIDG